MGKKLKDKVAIVTGASKGIGAEVALELASEGASVVVNYSSSKEGADRVVSEIIKNGGKAVSIQADMTKQADIKRLFNETQRAFKKIDVLINNAGVYEFVPLEEITAEHFHKLFDLNVLGLIFACQEAVKNFGPSGGSIVNISSLASTLGKPHSTVYGGTKAAVDIITKTLGRELGARKIRVNSVNPGLVDTEGVRSSGIENDLRKEVEANTPLGRIGHPKDIATAVTFLASDDASWITGETLFISGGYR